MRPSSVGATVSYPQRCPFGTLCKSYSHGAGIGDTGIAYPGDGTAKGELETVEAAQTDPLQSVYQQFAFSGFDPLFYVIHIITG